MPVLIPPRQPLDLGELNQAPQDPQEDTTVPSFQQQQQQQHVLYAPLRAPPQTQARIYNIAVTGFGPFQNVPVNPSWACLQPLRENGGLFTTLSDAHRPMRIACFEVPVVYGEVLERIPRLHGLPVEAPSGIDESRTHRGDSSPVKEAAFDAFVHVGVASARQYISIEERARRFGYENKDFLGHHAPSDQPSQLAGFVDGQWSVDEGKGQLKATVSVADVATSITQLGLADVRVSDDPGLYLCEFIYYASLACAKRRAMSTSSPPKPVIFVHIPDVSDRFPLHQLTDIIFAMVSELVDGLAA